jgi:hypothetical protein
LHLKCYILVSQSLLFKFNLYGYVEERLQLCAEFWRGRYAVAVAMAEDGDGGGNGGRPSSSKAGQRPGSSKAGQRPDSSKTGRRPASNNGQRPATTGRGSGGGGPGGGLHQPRSTTTAGGAGDQVKIQALPFVYPKSQPWPRKGGSMGYFEDIAGAGAGGGGGGGGGHHGGGDDENTLPFGGGGGGGGGGGSARITGRGGGVSGKRNPVASPEAGASRSLAQSRSRTTSGSGVASAGLTTSRHGGGFHASWSDAPKRAMPPAAALSFSAGQGSGHNFLGSRGGGGGGGGAESTVAGSGPRAQRFGSRAGPRPQTSGGVL